MINIPKSKQQIVISGVPESLLAKIDQIAKAEDRSRASVVRRLLEQIVNERRLEKAA
jgi:metal-responsive CopG/Arc/MetJ family transcriptional regulator